MFIRAMDANDDNTEILINTDHVKYTRTTYVGGTVTKDTDTRQCIVKFYGVDNELSGRKSCGWGYGADNELTDMLTSTIVPVAGAGYDMVYLRAEDEGHVTPVVDETPIIAFRVFDGYGVPFPIIVDECNGNATDGMSSESGIRMPSGRVLMPYRQEFESVDAFRDEIMRQRRGKAVKKARKA